MWATHETNAPWLAEPVGGLHLGRGRHERAVGVALGGLGTRRPRRGSASSDGSSVSGASVSGPRSRTPRTQAPRRPRPRRSPWGVSALGVGPPEGSGRAGQREDRRPRRSRARRGRWRGRGSGGGGRSSVDPRDAGRVTKSNEPVLDVRRTSGHGPPGPRGAHRRTDARVSTPAGPAAGRQAGRAARGRAQRPQPGDREQARADRLDLPRELPQPGPPPGRRDEPEHRAADRHAGGEEHRHDPARRRPEDGGRRDREQGDHDLEPEHERGRRPRPRAIAIDALPAASSRSTSTMAFAIASAVPALAAAGTRTRNTPGRPPVAPYQPNTGRSGMPTANGSHESVVPFARRSYERPIASTTTARSASGRPPASASARPVGRRRPRSRAPGSRGRRGSACPPCAAGPPGRPRGR